MHEIYFHKNANAELMLPPNFKQQRLQIMTAKIDFLWKINMYKTLPSARVKDAVAVAAHISYLLRDCAGTFDELPLGEAVSGAELQGSSLLDQVDAAMAQLLHPCLDLETNLKAQPGINLYCVQASRFCLDKMRTMS